MDPQHGRKPGMNGIFLFVFAFTIVGAFLLVPLAIRHDRELEEPDPFDYEAWAEDEDQRRTDDADAWRKGE
jgi:hypothetical protein